MSWRLRRSRKHPPIAKHPPISFILLLRAFRGEIPGGRESARPAPLFPRHLLAIHRSPGAARPTSKARRSCNKRGQLKARIHITLKSGVLDPQGKAIQHALGNLGFSGVGDVRQGKFIEIELAETDAARARTSVEAMCRQLLANTVIENYVIEFA
jgi:phosphoribosylformylglycinamidine synthase subunit PurS